jgi:soluble lytic murein transglycosylase-like protein
MKRKIILFLSLIPSFCFAGNQQYEVLKQETQQMMSKMISDQPPKVSSFSDKNEETQWMNSMKKHLSHFSRNVDDADTLLKTVHYEATRAGIDPIVILGLMQVESGFKKYAISSVSARGYMQVMPFWINLIGDKDHNIFHMRTNLRYGCTILRHYLELEHGNLFRALGRYNGSLGKAEYPNSVMAAANQFKRESK